MTIQAIPKRMLCGVAAETDEPGEQLALCHADRHAADQVIGLAAKIGASVRFVHVVDFLDQRKVGGKDAIVDAVREELGPALDELVDKAREAGVEASWVLRDGKAWLEMLREARDAEADLIAISPLREAISVGQRILHGSTARRIVRAAELPVWIIEPRLRQVERIMALVDLLPVSQRVIDTAAALADAFGAERFVLSCLDYPDDIVLHRLPNAHKAIVRYHREVKQKATKALEELTGGSAAGWKLRLEDDWVVRRAPKIIDEEEIDMVVLGCASRTAIAGAILGTTAERLLERCYVSAWVVRPEDWKPNVDLG